MLCSMLVYTTDALPNLQFQRALAHWLSTILARPLNYGPTISLLDPLVQNSPFYPWVKMGNRSAESTKNTVKLGKTFGGVETGDGVKMG